MANNYFDFLGQNSKQESAAEGAKSDGLVNLTVRADAECQVVCDGDFLFLLNANQITKEKVPIGQHILQFISLDYPDICVEKIVDFPDPRKNYLVLVNEFKQLLARQETIEDNTTDNEDALGCEDIEADAESNDFEETSSAGCSSFSSGGDIAGDVFDSMPGGMNLL
jgi:hypothetical protein